MTALSVLENGCFGFISKICSGGIGRPIMRLVTFEVETPVGRIERLGALLDDKVVDLNAAFQASLWEEGEHQAVHPADVLVPPDMQAFLQLGRCAGDAARRALGYATTVCQASDAPVGPRGERVLHKVEAIRLRAPLVRPRSLRDFLAFEAHAKAAFARRGEPLPDYWYKAPVYYKGNHQSIVGPDEEVVWPRYTERLDYELELACVIGRGGQNISAREASAYIAGYTIMNDWSARDIQREEMVCRLGPAKGKDFATSLGPCLVTPDELDPQNLRMVARVNGEVWSEGYSGSSYWAFPQMIEYVSMDEMLYPGDVLGSGTVGNGCGADLNRWIKPGDVVELAIEGIGILRNRVVKRGLRASR